MTPIEIVIVINVGWTLVLLWQSARLWALWRELGRERAEFKRWVRRHYENNTRERL